MSYTPMTKGEIWVGSSQNVLLCLLSTYVPPPAPRHPPRAQPVPIRNLRPCLRNKYKSTQEQRRGGAWSGRIADSNATVALSGKTGWRKAGVDRVPVYYLAGLQPAARLTSCLFILAILFSLSLFSFFLLFFFFFTFFLFFFFFLFLFF